MASDCYLVLLTFKSVYMRVFSVKCIMKYTVILINREAERTGT